MKSATKQELNHRIEALAHEHSNGIEAADRVEETHPELAREYRATAAAADADAAPQI